MGLCKWDGAYLFSSRMRSAPTLESAPVGADLIRDNGTLYSVLVFQIDMVTMQTSQTMITREIILKILALAFSIFLLQGCTALVVGAVVGTVATVAVEVVKVPFKVGGAVIDVVSDDDEEEDE